MRSLIAAFAILLPLTAFADDVPTGVGTQNVKLAANAVLPSKMSDATVLTTPEGKTLYVLASDMERGKSACNGTCAMTWPAFIAAADAKPTGEWSIFTRDDGSRQWAYKGKPLYTYAKDEKPGDAKGHNVLQIWTAVTASPPTQSASK